MTMYPSPEMSMTELEALLQSNPADYVLTHEASTRFDTLLPYHSALEDFGSYNAPPFTLPTSDMSGTIDPSLLTSSTPSLRRLSSPSGPPSSPPSSTTSQAFSCPETTGFFSLSAEQALLGLRERHPILPPPHPPPRLRDPLPPNFEITPTLPPNFEIPPIHQPRPPTSPPPPPTTSPPPPPTTSPPPPPTTSPPPPPTTSPPPPTITSPPSPPLPSAATNPLHPYGIPHPSGAHRCAHPDCTSQQLFRRACDLRKHYRRHSKRFFCRHGDGAAFSSPKDRARHEAGREPRVGCEWEGCGRVFSRADNMKDHVRRIHLGGRGR